MAATGNSGLTVETTTANFHLLLNPPSLPSSSSSPDILFDLISKILLRLPVKSLLRFRCVCKPWNALISDPQFAKEQLRLCCSSRRHLIVFKPTVMDYPLDSVMELSTVNPTHRYCPYGSGFSLHLFGSCHGMLCVATRPTYPVVFNPCTGKFKNLPTFESHWDDVESMSYGFGYDHVSDSYKVVALVFYRQWRSDSYREYDIDSMVHTLGTDSWTKIEGFPVGFSLRDRSGRFVSGSGTLNWLTRKPDRARSPVIVSLDLGTETYQQLSLPDFGVNDKGDLFTEVLKGYLCIFASRETAVDVWLMKDYGNKDSWIKLFSVPYQRDYHTYDRDRRAYRRDYYPESPYYTSVLGISDEYDEILLQVNSLEDESCLVVYNSKSDTFRTPGIQGFRDPMIYEDSLISPRFLY